MRTCQKVDFAVQTEHWAKIKKKKNKDKYLDLTRDLYKIMEHEVDGDTNCKRCTYNDA